MKKKIRPITLIVLALGKVEKRPKKGEPKLIFCFVFLTKNPLNYYSLKVTKFHADSDKKVLGQKNL